MSATTTRKSRTISLRLSEPEFEALRTLHAANGARSISEFIRSSMQHLLVAPPPPGQALELKVQEIDGKLSILDGEVARLIRLLEGHDQTH